MASNLDFRMRLTADAADFRRNMAQAQRDLLNFQAAANRINAQIPNPARNISSGGGLAGLLSLNVSSLNPITAGIRGIGKAALGAVASIAGIGLGLREAIAATRQYQSLLTRFKYAFDGLEEGKNQLQFIREEANRLGLDFNAAANGYAQLAAATKNLNITTEQTQQIFKGVASAVAGMGLGAEDAQGVFLALSQIAGKGKVSMEELRQQLGERLTPAMAIAAKSMGVTTAELEKMVEKGISAEKFLPKFGAALEEAFGTTAAENVNTLNGQINLLRNKFNEFLVSIGEGGLSDGVIAIFKDLTEGVTLLQGKLTDFMEGAGGATLKEGLSSAWELLKSIGGTIAELYTQANSLFGELFVETNEAAESFSLLNSTLNGAALVFAAFQDSIKAVSIAINLVAGAIKDAFAYIDDFSAKAAKGFGFKKAAEELKASADTLHASAQKNYDTAQKQASEFESNVARVTRNIIETGNAAGHAYDAAAESAKKAAEAAKSQEKPLTEAEKKVKELEQAFKDAESAASELGVDMKAATAAVTAQTANALQGVDKLAKAYTVLKDKGVDAALLIRQALSSSLKNAANEKDIEAIKAKYVDLGKTGKLAMEDVESGILAADLRLQELRGETDATAAAFKKLGVQTKEAMKLSAAEMRQAFERVKKSGEASQEELSKAFAKTAEALLQSGDASQRAWVAANAATYQYRLTVDSTGKAALQSAADVKQAASEQQKAHQQATSAVQAHADAEKQVGDAAQEAAKQKDAANEQAAKNEMQRLDSYGEAVHYTLGKMKAYQNMGSAAWLPTLQGVWRLHDNIRASITQLNDDMVHGGNLATSLARAEALALGNASKLDKTTLSNLQSAIDAARQKMQELGDAAKSAAQTAQKELLQLQGKTEQVAKMEQQQKIAELNAKLQEARAQGNRQAEADYGQAIAATQQAYQLKQQQEREAKAAEEREAREREQEKKAQQNTPPVNITLPDAPKLDLSQVDLSNLEVDTSALLAAIKQRDASVSEQLQTQLPDLVKQITPLIMNEIVKTLHMQLKNQY